MERETVASRGGLLLERERELAAIADMLDRVEDREGGCLVIVGDPGSGKSSLLAHLGEEAADRAISVRAAIGAEVETGFPFGVIGQLCPEAPRGKDLQRSQRKASEALLELIEKLTAAGPAVLSVDRAHCADPQSLGALEFLSRRIRRLPVLLAVAGDESGEPGGEATLSSLVQSASVATLRPAPLSAEAISTLIERQIEQAPTVELVEAVEEAAAGNPLMSAALARTLSGPHPPARSRHLCRFEPPQEVRILARTQLSRVEPEQAAVAAAAAVLGEHADPLSTAEVTEMERERVSEHGDGLTAVGLFGDELQLNFSHPLVGQAVYDSIPPHRRADLHRRAAVMLSDRGSSSLEVAAHLLCCRPDGSSWAVEHLREAAALTRSQGDPAYSQRLLLRAMEELPDRRSDDLALELASSAAEAGDLAAVELLRELIATGESAPVRLQAAVELMGCLVFACQLGEALTVAERVLEREKDAEGPWAEVLRAERAVIATLSSSARYRSHDHLRAIESRITGNAVGIEVAKPTYLAALAVDRAVSGAGVDEVAGIAERAIDEMRQKSRGLIRSWTRLTLVMAFMWSERPESAERLLTSLIRDAKPRVTTRTLCLALAFRSHVRMQLGRIDEAVGDATTYVAIAPRGQWLPFEWLASATLITANLLRGNLEAAEEASRLTVVPSAADGLLSEPLREALALLHLAKRDPKSALVELRPCERLEEFWGGEGGPVPIPWRARRALASLAAGDRDEAVLFATEEQRLAQRTGHRRAEGIALHTLALTSTGDDQVVQLREAVAMLESATASIELAAAEADLGAALRRGGDTEEARAILTRAHDRASGCGASALAERASAELEMAGGTPVDPEAATDDELTQAELRVASLASEGLTNREISADLYLSVKTIEFHLTRVYRKLEIRSRRELRKALRERCGEAPTPLAPSGPPQRSPTL